MSQENYDPELAAFAASLSALKPTNPGIDRDRLMYEAGQRSVRRGWGWPVATLVMSGAAAVLGLFLLIRPEPQVIERTLVVKEPVRPAPVETVTPPAPVPAPEPVALLDAGARQAGTDYLKLRQQVLRLGVDVLPSPPPVSGSAEPLTVEKLLESLDRPRSVRPKSTQPGDRS